MSVFNAITADANPYVKFHELLNVLYLHVSNCLTCKLWAHDALMSFGRYADIAANLEHLDHDYVKKGDVLTLHGTCKRKRMDAHLRMHISSDVKANRTAPTTAAYLRSHPELAQNPTSSAAGIDNVFLSCVQAATWLECANAAVFTLSFDGVVCGNPSREHIPVSLTMKKNQFGTWLPVAVLLKPQ